MQSQELCKETFEQIVLIIWGSLYCESSSPGRAIATNGSVLMGKVHQPIYLKLLGRA